MQLKVQKRFAAGAQVLASYTIAKLIDNTNSEINWLEAASPSWGDANAYNLRGERSLDGFDVPQRLVIGSILDLPVGQGKTIGKDETDLPTRSLAGGALIPSSLSRAAIRLSSVAARVRSATRAFPKQVVHGRREQPRRTSKAVQKPRNR